MRIDLRAIARRATGRALAARGAAGSPPRQGGVHVTLEPCGTPLRPAADASEFGEGRGEPLPRARLDVVTSADLAGTPDGGTLTVPLGARLTTLAREEAERRGLILASAHAGSRAPAGEGRLRVAVGCDHGGYEMKLDVLGWLRELGHEPVDLGTHDENAVDYPDYARAVAEAVAEGRCHLGICVDGAGIGSAMAANKVRGVRAANCWDVATARNAREHNYANVLTLGGRMLGHSVALDVVRTFLATPPGAERHGKRVAKIMAIEEQR